MSAVTREPPNPIEIGAVVVWQVFDTAESVFEVDDYENYVHSEQATQPIVNTGTLYR